MKKVARTFAVAMAAAFIAGAAVAQDVVWTLYNQSAYTVMEFYASPASSNDWGADLLGSGVLESGGGGTVTIADGESVCDYDLLFVLDDGSEYRDTVDICTLDSYTLN